VFSIFKRGHTISLNLNNNYFNYLNVMGNPKMKNKQFLDETNGITRRQFLEKSTSGLGLAMVVPQLLNCGKTGSKSRPNILLLVADDAGWRDVGYHDSEIKTPHIDKLIKTGVELNQFYVCPTCSPTRASLLSGRYASRFGILGPIAMKSKQILPTDIVSLPEMLRREGYATAITGKWHLGLRPENGPRQYGFEYTYGYLHGQIDQFTHEYKNGDRSWHRNDVFVDEEGHATDLITNEAIQYIKELRDKSKPFFLYVPFSVPHYPLQEEKKWVKSYEESIDNESRRVFAASVTHMDDSIGQLIETLETEKLRNNTLVIFISDNGGQEKWYPTFEYNLKHGPNDRLGDNHPLRDWKASLYEGGIRVPAVINWPAKLKPRKVDQVMNAVDIYPTIAQVTGTVISQESHIEGKDAWETISRDTSIGERILYWRTNKQIALRKGDWKLVHTDPALAKGSNELYDLKYDPHEKKDIAKKNPEILAELLDELKKQVSLDGF
jgi:arylsulfatase A-like enzyme